MIRTIVLFIAIGFNAIAQVNEDRDITNFSYIKVSHGIEVVYAQSDFYKVIVSANLPGLIGYIKTEIKGDTLNIRFDKSYKDKISYKDTKLEKVSGSKVYVYSPKLKGAKVSLLACLNFKDIVNEDDFDLHVSSSGEFKGDIKSNNCDINMSSSGKVFSDIIASNGLNIKGMTSAKFEGNINVDNLDISATNSSKIKLSGNAKNALVVLTASANINALDLKIDCLDVTVSQFGKCSFNVAHDLKANASTSGYLEYYGKPQNKDIQTSTEGIISNK